MQLNKLVELTNADKKRIEKYKPIEFKSWKFGTYILICIHQQKQFVDCIIQPKKSG